MGIFLATGKPAELVNIEAAGVKRGVFYPPPLMGDGPLPTLNALVPLAERFT